jgi:hypothetical protein
VLSFKPTNTNIAEKSDHGTEEYYPEAKYYGKITLLAESPLRSIA